MISRKIIAFLLTLSLMIGFSIPSVNAISSSSPTEQINVIVGFNPNTISSQSARNNSVTSLGGQINKNFAFIKAASATMSVEAAQALAKNPNIAYVEPDYPVYSLAQTTTWGIDAVYGHEPYPFTTSWAISSGSGIGVAVLDTGINAMHEDLPALAGGYNAISGSAYYWGSDQNGHGTHVAGIIAAQANSVGVVGVAPRVSLYSVKVLDETGSGYVSSVIAGIEWAVSNNIQILTMSFGSLDNSIPLKAACDTAYAQGHLLVAAAGNSGTVKGTEQNVQYPAAYASVIAVAASDIYGNRASFSSTGDQVELIAPGVNILSGTSSASVSLSAGGVTYTAKFVEGSSAGSIIATRIVDCGLALTEDSVRTAVSNAGISSPSPWVALIDRGDSTFAQKVSNAITFGAVGAIIINNDSSYPNDPGSFTLYSTTSSISYGKIPVLSVSSISGITLRGVAASPGLTSLSVYYDKYEYLSGTSMAAPHVAGVAAVLWAANPSLINTSIRSLLTGSAIYITSLSAIQQGYGFVRADLALSLSASTYPTTQASVQTLTLSNFTANSKIYDGTTTVSGTAFADNRQPSHILTFTYSAAFLDKNAGAAKAVSFSGITLSGGTDMAKYNLLQTTGTAIATISKAALTISGTFTAIDKSFDNSATATMENNSLTLSGIIAGDTVTIGSIGLQFSDATAGVGKTVNISSVTLQGTDANNYSVSLIGSPTASATIAAVVTPPGGGGGGLGGGGGGGAIIEPEPVVLPVTTVVALTLKFNVGLTSSFFTSGSALEQMKTMDAAPMIFEGRMLLPIRFVVEPLGGTIAWNQAEQKVTIIKGTTTIELWIGNNIAKINGVSTSIDPDNSNVKPLIINPGRTMLPIRFISEALACKVDWDQTSQEVTVTK